MGIIHVDEAALNYLKGALQTAGGEYKNNLAKLKNLITEITNGDIQGDLADDLKAKFEAKEATFDKITQTIEEAEGYMGVQTTKFTALIDDTKDAMK